MKIAYVLAAVAAFAVVAPAMAADREQKDDKDAPKEKKICRNEMVTGSLIAKRRICKTQAEWEQLAQDTKNSLDAYTSKQNGTVPVTLGPPPFQH
jgi:predicted secreted protein